MEFTVFPIVRNIAHKTVLRATPEMTVHQASGLMDKNNVSSLILERADGRYIFTVEDLLKFVHDGGHGETILDEIRLRKVHCILEDEHVLAAMELLEHHGGRYLGVIDVNDNLVGILTYTDIMSAIDPTVLVERKSIGDLISRTEPVTFSPDWILEDVLFHLNKIEDSIVVVESGIPVGIITTKDVFGIVAEGKDTSQPLAHYMTTPVVTTDITASIHETLMQLRTFKIKRAIVVNGHRKLAGVVTQSELVGFAYGSWINLIKHHAGELKELVAILEEKARGFEKVSMTDPLTGLGNRRAFHQRMNEEIDRIQRYQSPSFSMLLFDIDFFKRINDTHGHLVGDQVLKSIASEVTALIRKTDQAIRWGGEEFAVLLPCTGVNEAAEFASRLRSRIADFVFIQGIQVTISIGVGEYLAGEQDKVFLERIDGTMYRAKTNGRNRVETDHPV